jgi:hypothetical protein
MEKKARKTAKGRRSASSKPVKDLTPRAGRRVRGGIINPCGVTAQKVGTKKIITLKGGIVPCL